MHSSYALNSEDFVVERGGADAPLSELWAGGYQPGVDRLGVILAQPMDGCGCSNLICGTNTLFYDALREKHGGQGSFFRYADTYVIGVGCEPGDYNQLDVWPMHKFVTLLQPTAEALLETINDRRITLLAIPETGCRTRGEVVLSTWNAYLQLVRSVVTYSPRSGRARDADLGLVGNKVVESYVEQAIFTTPGLGAGEQARLRRLRRAIDREPMRSLPNAAAARALLGVSEVLPPGHQEVSRRSQPVVIMPVEAPLPPIEASPGALVPASSAPPAPLETLTVNEPAEPEDTTSVFQLPMDVLRKTAFDAVQRRMNGSFAEWEGWDWISDFGDPIAEHHAVRETVGVWDESPLQKWAFRGPDALQAADYCFTSDMAALAVGQVRYGPFCDERGKMLGDGTVYNTGNTEAGILVVTALPTDAEHFRQVCAGRFDVEIADETESLPHVQVQGPRSRELIEQLTDADIAGLKYFRFVPQRVTIGGVEGCWISRTGYSGEVGYEIFCRPEGAEQLWRALLDQGAAMGIRPYGLAAVESLRIESGLIFIGFDYFPSLTSPFHMNLERSIKLDKPAFHGQAALVAEEAAGITHRMVTLVIAGEESPDYGTPVIRDGREIGKLLSPSAGRSPSVDRLIGLACIEAEYAKLSQAMNVTLADGRLVPALVERYPIYDPQKTRPRA